MANYDQSIDLLKLRGASIKSVELTPGKRVNCFVIPCKANGAYIGTNDKGEITSGYIHLSSMTVSEKFKKACLERNAEKENYVAPSHQISLSLPKEMCEEAIKTFGKRLREDAQFMANHPSDEEVARQARYRLYDLLRCGTMTPFVVAEKPSFTGNAPAAAVAEADMNAVQPEDDLPF